MSELRIKSTLRWKWSSQLWSSYKQLQIKRRKILRLQQDAASELFGHCSVIIFSGLRERGIVVFVRTSTAASSSSFSKANSGLGAIMFLAIKLNPSYVLLIVPRNQDFSHILFPRARVYWKEFPPPLLAFFMVQKHIRWITTSTYPYTSGIACSIGNIDLQFFSPYDRLFSEDILTLSFSAWVFGAELKEQ